MHGKEEWVLIWLGSQYKCVERPVRPVPANISTSDQRCFNVVGQRWKKVDLTLKMKQNLTPDCQRFTTSVQCQCLTLKQRRNDVAQRRNNLVQRCARLLRSCAASFRCCFNVGHWLCIDIVQRCFNVASILVKAVLNPIGLVMIMDL